MVRLIRGLAALVLAALATIVLAPARATACVCAQAQPEVLSPRADELDVPTNAAVVFNAAAPAVRLTGPDGEVALAAAEAIGGDALVARPLATLAARTPYQIWFDSDLVSSFVTGDGPTSPPPAPDVSARAGLFTLSQRSSCAPPGQAPAMTIDLDGVATTGLGRAAFIHVLTLDRDGAVFSERLHRGSELLLTSVTCEYELPELQAGETACPEVVVFDLAGQASPVVRACAKVRTCPTITGAEYVEYSYRGPPECLTEGCSTTPSPSVAVAALLVAAGLRRRRPENRRRGAGGRG